MHRGREISPASHFSWPKLGLLSPPPPKPQTQTESGNQAVGNADRLPGIGEQYGLGSATMSTTRALKKIFRKIVKN